LDFAAGTLGAIVVIAIGLTGPAAFVENVGDGWFRVSFSGGIGTSNTAARFVVGPTDTDGGRTGTAGEDIIVYQADLVKASAPSSPIITNGATATRAAETLTIASADTPYNTTANSISSKLLATYADTGTPSSTSGGAGEFMFYTMKTNNDNFIEAYLTTDNADDAISVVQKSAATRDIVFDLFTPTPGVNVPFNISTRHVSTAVNIAIDGTLFTENATPTSLPDLSATVMQPGFILNGTYQKFIMWGEDITDAGIAEAST
jgi:hypothetical protein